MKYFSAKTFFLYSSILFPAAALAQTGSVYKNTEVPTINITPDSRSGAMGEAGVAISPDVNANYWNPSKLAFLESNNDVSISYSPWQRNLVPDESLSYLSFAHKIGTRNAIGLALHYFNFGSVPLTDNFGNSTGTYTPSEFSLNASYARTFGDDFSLGLTTGFIHSNYSTTTSGGQQAQAGNAIAAGVSFYYHRETQEFGKDGVFSFGTYISNIGSKISYSTDGPKYFLPTNLKIGVANLVNIDDFNQLTFTFDINKLLVPTSPIRDANGNIIKGKDDNVSVPEGIFGSFSGAPGGFTEQLQEITLSPGLEYWYNQLFALRAGYFYQNPINGGSHYVTLGVGFKYSSFKFDFSYIAGSQQSSGLSNTLRFTLTANFGGEKNADNKEWDR